jgi:hypothetical protein
MNLSPEDSLISISVSKIVVEGLRSRECLLTESVEVPNILESRLVFLIKKLLKNTFFISVVA